MSETVRGGEAAPEPAAPLATQSPGFPQFLARAWPWAAGVLLAVAVWAVYGPALSAPIVYDDHVTVLLNPSIRHLWPLVDGTGSAPLSPPASNPTSGRPLVNFTLALNYAIGGANPVGYRVFNILLHTLSAWLVWGIVRRTLRLEYFHGRFEHAAEPLALAVALVWALHPLQTEAIEYVTQRTELMVALFYLATLYAGLRYFAAAEPRPRAAWCAAAVTASLLGMACKEVMVTVPIIVLLFERTFIAGTFRAALGRSWPLYAGLAASWLLLLALNAGNPRADSAGFHAGVPLLAYWYTQAKVLLLYLKLAVWPWPLVISYELPLNDTLSAAWPWLLAASVLVVATAVLLWRRRAAGFVGACVLIILSPTLLVPIVREVAAERRMYLPLAALVAWVFCGGYLLLRTAAEALAGGWNPSNTVGPLAAGRLLRRGVARGRSVRRRQHAAVVGVRNERDSLAGRRVASAGQLDRAVQLGARARQGGAFRRGHPVSRACTAGAAG